MLDEVNSDIPIDTGIRQVVESSQTATKDAPIWMCVLASGLLKIPGFQKKALAVSTGEYSQTELISDYIVVIFGKYPGPNLQLPKLGVTIHPNDEIGDINIDNDILPSSLKERDLYSLIARDFLNSLIAIANRVEKYKFPNVVALTAFSHLVNPKLFTQLGFEENKQITGKNKFLASLLASYISLSLNPNQDHNELFNNKWRRVCEVWITPEEIVSHKPTYIELAKKFENRK